MLQNRQGLLVTFSGVDGAGKSTQIEILMKRLSAAAKQPIYFWSRGGYTPGFNVLKAILRRLSRGHIVPPSGPSRQRTKSLANPWKRRLWLILALLDLIVFYAVILRWWCYQGRPVVCDRYWQDTLIDFRLNFPDEKVEQWKLWQLLKKLAPKPDASFLMLVPVTESVKRSRQKDEPFPDPPEVLAQRLAQYRAMAEENTWCVLDGCLAADQIAEIITDHLRGEHPPVAQSWHAN